MESFKGKALEALRRLFSSAKFYTFITGLIVAYAARKGLELDPEIVMAILGLTGMLIGAQGLQDFGEKKAKIEAAAPKAPEQLNIQNVTAPTDGAQENK